MDKVIWKLLGEWSYFVGNILMGVKDVSTYQKKKKKGVYKIDNLDWYKRCSKWYTKKLHKWRKKNFRSK